MIFWKYQRARIKARIMYTKQKQAAEAYAFVARDYILCEQFNSGKRKYTNSLIQEKENTPQFNSGKRKYASV